MEATITIHDVAQRAGCSIATVSRVLNGHPATSPEARRRVDEAVTALRYRPSHLGRSLRARRTATIGVLVPSLTNPVFAASVAGTQERARARGYGVLVAATEYDASREVQAVETLLAQSVEGLVLTVADGDASPALDLLDDLGRPYVLVFNQPRRPGRAAVSVDNVAAAADAARRLIALGHRGIGMVAGRFSTSDRSRLRREGLDRALREAGLPPAPVTEVDYESSEHDAAIAALLAGPDPPTALFCSNDLLAISVMAALRRLGRRAPESVSVVGFDGIGFGALVEPSLATVEQPTREMGRTAFELLEATLSRTSTPGIRLLGHRFREGGSIGAPPRPPHPLRSPHPPPANPGAPPVDHRPCAPSHRGESNS